MSIDNPIANEYVIELPQLIDILPTKEELLTLKNEKLASSTCNPEYTSNWDGQTWYSVLNDAKVNNVTSLFNEKFLIKSPETWLCVKDENKWIRPHIDTDRLAVLIYPIVPESYDIQFTDTWLGNNQEFFFSPYEDTVPYDYNVIHTHTYTCPTILNSKIPHCLPAKIAKTTFQISLYFGGKNCSDWTEILNEYNKGELVNLTPVDSEVFL